ncbi:protein TIC 100-like [Selaginella moellendorffii]|uniref:protein TIC 100-like n=1 Tax=Selaginella moellendorffii TaxID=88036 RepID=UPI000D1CE3A9|nr:protein TIC 100-like [Selaginella moellendorffii]|eukprot:XP_024537235.1 protein TIC 100-like [Selaginella moellendorffii]
MAKTEETTKAETAAVEKKNEPEMMRYEDYRGNVQVFPKPPEPNIVDLIDQETWGTDEEEILPEEEEESEEEVEFRFVPPPRRRAPQLEEPKEPDEDSEKKKLREQEIMELSREQDRRIAEERQRKKLERVKKKEEIIKDRLKNEYEATWNFPVDLEGWTEEDLGEEWVDPPLDATGSGYDPMFAPPPPDEDLDKVIAQQTKRSRKQKKEFKKYMDKQEEAKTPLTEDGYPARPYYVPYRLPYPSIPKIHAEVENAFDVVEELEKIEEFLRVGELYLPDGSSYEGTIWDDLAHGKGVYTSMFEDVQYEGMWRRNMMEGHGVLHVHIPVYQPPPDSKLEKEMRDQGWIIKADYMPPEEREWLKKDIEDTLEKPNVTMKESELYENDPYWIELYGELPEKGRYKYSGQWKHNRMHGCGVLDVNTRLIYGKFYFGELLGDPGECTLEACAIHSGLAQVAAAKAKMFTKKPDGMVREMDGPFNDPQHPYFYEDEDVWMAPGWVNAYYEVPDPWKIYVEEVDKEQQMWLNSFIKSPLRIPMPAELEYMWENGDEFIVLTNEPSSYGWLDEENVLKSHPNFEGEILYHVPTGRLINWIYDKDGNIKFFWQPYKEDGSIKPEEAVFLPDGWDEFFSDEPMEDPDGLKDPQDLTREERLKKYKEEDEQMEREWQKEKEEMERRWREEDEERKEEMKLRAEIEDEAIEEELRQLDEIEQAMDEADRLRKEAKKKGPEKMEKPEQPTEKTVVEEDEEEEEEPSTLDKAVEQDEVEPEEDTKRSFGKTADDEDEPRSFGKVDEDEDGEEEGEEDKKPRGFGKVAMLEEDSNRPDEKISDRTSKSAFPTAFAAITISPWLRAFTFPMLRRHQQQKQASGGGEKTKNFPSQPSSDLSFPERMEPVKIPCATKKSFVTLRTTRSCNSSVVLLERRKNTTLQNQRSRKSYSWKISEQDVFSIAIPV